MAVAAQSGTEITNATTAEAGGLLSVSQSPIAFAMTAGDLPAPGETTTLEPTEGSPFHVTAGVAVNGRWFLEVGVIEPITDPTSLETIPSRDLAVMAAPTIDSPADACPAIPWTPLGASVRIAALDGPVLCHYLARIRLTVTGRHGHGTFEGELTWALRRDAP